MQMDISIYQTFDSYPVLIQQKSRAGPCQSNLLSPHNNTNVFPLRTVQLIKGKFVWRRICGSQENAGHGFFHFLELALGASESCLLTLFKSLENNAKMEMHITNSLGPV